MWHYTCDHGRAGIGRRGLLLPARDLTRLDGVDYWPADFVWLTDLGTPIRDALGLTMRLAKCDRTAHRYRVLDERDVVPWRTVRRTVVDPWLLEDVDGARPAHWFVARVPVPVVLDERRE